MSDLAICGQILVLSSTENLNVGSVAFCQIICSLSVSLLRYPHSTSHDQVNKLDLLLIFQEQKREQLVSDV